MYNFTSRRPAKTILVDAGSIRFRVDLSRKDGRFSVIRVLTCDDHDVPPESNAPLDTGFDTSAIPLDDGAWITSLLREKPRPARAIKILSVKVSAAVMEISILGGESEEEAIAMELESITGLNSAETQFTWKRLSSGDGMLKAWAIQASFQQLMVWRKAVVAVRGCYVTAICHPAGLSIGSDHHLELWPDFAFYQESEGGTRDLSAWNGENAASVAFLDEAVLDAIDREALTVLIPRAPLPLEARSSPAINLDEEVGRLRWVNQLATGLDPLSFKLESIPRLGIPKPEMSTCDLVRLGVGVTAAALALIGGHYFYLKKSINSLDAQVEAMRAPVDELRDNEKEITNLQRQLRTLKGTPVDTPFDLEAHRQRLASVLQVLAVSTNESIVMQAIESRGLQVLVRGVSATSHGPASYVRILNEKTERSGWRASLAGREATLFDADGGPWAFIVELTPLAEAALSVHNNKGN